MENLTELKTAAKKLAEQMTIRWKTEPLTASEWKQRRARLLEQNRILMQAELERRIYMGLPNTRLGLYQYGYVRLADTRPGGAHCSSCNKPLEWWLTLERRRMPFEVQIVDGAELLVPHFATCPKAQKHRKPKRAITEISTQKKSASA